MNPQPIPQVFFRPLLRSLHRQIDRPIHPSILLLTVCLVLRYGAAICGQEVTVLADSSSSSIIHSPAAFDFFETHIRPVLVDHCYQCHSSESSVIQGGLLLDTAERMRRGGDSGELFIPGQSEESLLMAVLNWEQYEMPPSAKLPDSTIQHFKDWIEMGAPDPRVQHDPVGEAAEVDFSQHWAFQAPVKHVPPPFAGDEESWPVSEIDQFVLPALRQAGLEFSPVAEPRLLLRRLHFVLTGLSPTFQDYQNFAALAEDQIYEAFEQGVDRLLDTPEFGQRWGRHWLDVARYADTKGYVFQEDRNYYQAYRYRDWVIDAFNSDLPYDQFVVAQLAADRLEDTGLKPAMGFLTLGRRFINNQQDIIDDRIDVMSRGLMGLTIACARCHDHKYDPISIEDYYSLYGVFASSHEPRPPSPEESPGGEVESNSAPPKATASFSDDDWLMLRDSDPLYDPVVFIRGNPHNRGGSVPRQFPRILSAENAPPFQQGSGRFEMAQAIASPNNPLTARVWVNRVWMHLIGEGLVTTPSDFGTRGHSPTHPELLDWLTCRFIEEGWSTKWLIKEILLSRTFSQSSRTTAEGGEIDPENRLLWRMNRRRLDWETLRDNLLLASGDLDVSLKGPAVDITSQPAVRRRTVYGFIDRQNLPGQFRTFDFASPDSHVAKRPHTVVPQQALFLMNSPFAIEQAIRLANQIDTIQRTSDPEKIAALFRLALGREPEPAELEGAIQFLSAAAIQPSDPSDANPWSYGWGKYNQRKNQLEFHPLPHFNGTAWQGGTELPDPELGWVTLNANGGHPGNKNHAAIRRWTAPQGGELRLSGTLVHAAEQGDGVRGRLISDRQGLLQEWTAHRQTVSTQLDSILVEPGECLNFVTDCRRSESFDSFEWRVQVQLTPDPASSERWQETEDRAAIETNRPQNGPIRERLKWDSREEFSGPTPQPLNRWQQLAQVLLMTNEFMFVD